MGVTSIVRLSALIKTYLPFQVPSNHPARKRLIRATLQKNVELTRYRGEKRHRFQSVVLMILFVTPMALIPVDVTQAESPIWGQDIPHADRSSKDRHPRRVIVKFKEDVSPKMQNQLLARLGVRRLGTSTLTGISIIETTHPGQAAEQILEDIRKSGFVEYAEPDFILHVNVLPNDPRLPELWGLQNTGQNGGTDDADIDAPEAWEIETGNSNSVVGVIDTGVDYNHEDLAANMWVNPGEIPGNGIDDDGNQYVDDVYGIDCINDDSDPFDDHGHGTHVAGTIGAVGDNDIGVVGVHWQVNIMALKFLDAGGSGWTSDAIECLNYANIMKTDHGVNLKLTSNSWGGGGFSQALYETIEASGHAGMLFIAAAENSASDTDTSPHYPSSYDLSNLIAVAATTRHDDLASFSNWGATSVDLGAPGQDVLSTLPGNTYSEFSGTSMATPHVAGAAAMLGSRHPEFDLYDIKETLLSTVDPLPSLTGLVTSEGRLNLYTALTCEPNNPQLIASLRQGTIVEQGKPVVITAKLSACTRLRGAEVTANFSNTDPSLALGDDGVEPDRTANDGLYTASWIPQRLGPVTVAIHAVHNGTSFSISIEGEVWGV